MAKIQDSNTILMVRQSDFLADPAKYMAIAQHHYVVVLWPGGADVVLRPMCHILANLREARQFEATKEDNIYYQMTCKQSSNKNHRE